MDLHSDEPEVRNDDPEVRILTLNCWGLKLISKKRCERIAAISKQLASSAHDYDIVALQEVWVEKDYETLRASVQSYLPFAKRWHSGVLAGPGLVVFSRWPIESAWMFRFALNGRPSAFWRGDWYVGKGAGCCVILHPSGRKIEVINAHLHAPYAPSGDASYACHRASQAWDMSGLVSRAIQSGHTIFVTGDLNYRPQSVGLRLFELRAGLSDAWTQTHGSQIQPWLLRPTQDGLGRSLNANGTPMRSHSISGLSRTPSRRVPSDSGSMQTVGSIKAPRINNNMSPTKGQSDNTGDRDLNGYEFTKSDLTNHDSVNGYASHGYAPNPQYLPSPQYDSNSQYVPKISVSGSFNTQPGVDPDPQVMARMSPEEQIEVAGVTSDSQLNTWRAHYSLDRAKRLDYVFYDESTATAMNSRVTFTEPIPDVGSVSDHFGVTATFRLSTKHPHQRDINRDYHRLHEMVDEILDVIEDYKPVAKFQASWRLAHFWLSNLVIVGLLVGVWWGAASNRAYVGFIFIAVGIIVAVTGYINGLIGFVFGRNEKRALTEFEDQVRLAKLVYS